MSSPFMMDVNSLVSFTKGLPESKRDPVSNLLKHKTLLYSGTGDTVVFPGVMEKLREYYLAMGVSESDLKVIFNVPSQHAMITNFSGNDCSYLGSPFINNCNLDLAGTILQQVYGSDLSAPRGQAIDSNVWKNYYSHFKIESFSQSEFLQGASLASKGYLYIPEACKNNATCKLHVAFHGCKQNYDTVGDAYVKTTGYNQWAESNNIVILYPQTKASMLTNPNGCVRLHVVVAKIFYQFDWWGFDDAEYYSKNGKQMSAVRRMMENLAGISFDQ